MSVVERILIESQSLSPCDQRRLLRELARSVFQSSMNELSARPEEPLALSDDEIERLVHEARSEALRARGD